MKRFTLVFALIGLLLAACSQQATPKANLEAQASNTWKNLGGALDVVTKNNTANAKLLLDRNGKPVVLWAEDNGLWYLQGKRWNGVAWEKLNFPTRPLAYDDNGVIPFDVVIDSSNALVITQQGKILRATTTWTQLGFEETSQSRPTNQIQTDQYGRVHALFRNSMSGYNVIKRWDCKAWQTVIDIDATGDFAASPQSFALKPNGKPVISFSYPTSGTSIYENVLEWNGQTWNGVASVSGPCCDLDIFDYATTSDNKVVVALADTLVFPYIQWSGNKVGLGKGDFLALAVNKTSPVAMYRSGFDNPDFGKIFVSAWTGSKFTRLGGDIRRDTTKTFFTGQLLVDKNGTIFALSQESACFFSGTCGGANVYVSQYIP